MGIVGELQREAIDNKDLDKLIKKAYVVAKKLNLIDFEKWLYCELNGYTEEDEIPSYRKIKGVLKAKNLYNGAWIPVICDSIEMYNKIVDKYVTQSALELIELCKYDGEMQLSLPMEVNMFLSKFAGGYNEYGVFINKIVIVKIINEVKNKILMWSVELENRGIVGEKLSFSDEEKERASGTTNINNFFHTGDIAFQQNTEDSSQVQDNSIMNENNKELFNELKSIADKITDGSEKKIIDMIEAMEINCGKKNFKEKYSDFIQGIANHIAIFAPFIPALTALL